MTKAKQYLNKFQADLDVHFAKHGEANGELMSWIKDNFDQAELCQFIAALLEDKQSLELIAKRSYQHGNGFLKVVLLDNKYKLRLHIWFAGQACEENIHDHRWSFASMILTGQLKSEIWHDSKDGEVFNEFQYYAANKQQAPYKIDNGQAHLALLEARNNLPGDCYVMPKGQLHRIVNHGDQLVATMMCSAPTEQGTNRLIPINDGIDPNIQPPKTTVKFLQNALTMFLEHLLNQNSIAA